MKVPQVTKIQGKRSAWTNFSDICKTLKRTSEHVSQFFLTELGVEGSVVDNQLILKGKHMTKNIESLIIKYFSNYGLVILGEYVSCP